MDRSNFNNSSSARQYDPNKRKCYFGSAEKDRKHQRDDRWKEEDFPELQYSVSIHEHYTCYKPLSWADQMEEEDRIKSRMNERRTKNRYSPISWEHKTKQSGSNYGRDDIRDKDRDRHKKPLSELSSNDNSQKVTKRYDNMKKTIAKPLETDPNKLANRQKQICIGKNTPGYIKYTSEVLRKDRTKDHPWTPDRYTACSTRSWQGTVKVWRRKLHFWDPPEVVKEREESCFLNVSSSSNDLFKKNQINNSMNTDCLSQCSSETSSSQASTDAELNHLIDDELMFGVNGEY